MNKYTIQETIYLLKMWDFNHLNMNIDMSYQLIIFQHLINLNRLKLNAFIK